VPVRIPVEHFSPDRSQRRNMARNVADLMLTERPARFDPNHFRLYAAYLRSRHPDGGMSENITRESYEEFLLVPWGGETRLLEIRLRDRLVAVAVTDLLPQSLSAVYTFFDPDLSARALGTYAVLSQVAQARRLGLNHLYLGYCMPIRLLPKPRFWLMVTTGKVLVIAERCGKFHHCGALRCGVVAPRCVARLTRHRIHSHGS
jgi:arginine-tRNA-protein transferase